MSKLIPLKRLAAVSYGLGQPPRLSDHGVPILRATNIHRGKFVQSGLIFAALNDLPLDRAPLLRSGEVLVVRSGAYTGDSALVTDDWAGAAPGYDLRITPHGLDPRFLAYSLLGRMALDHMAVASSRAAQPHLNAEELGDLPVLGLSRERQRAIANYLDAETDRIDALIAKKQRLVDLLQQRFWTFVEAEILAVALADLPLRRLLVGITDGPFGSSLTSAHYVNEGARVVRLGNIGFAEFKSGDRAFISEQYYYTLRRHSVRAGDLLIAGLGDARNHVGRACVAPDLGDAIVKADCYCAKVDPGRADAEFLTFFLSSPVGAEAVSVAARGTTRSRINLEIAKEIRVPSVSLEEQRRLVLVFGAKRAAVRLVTSQIQAQLTLLSEHRQALITAAVTGELEDLGAA